MGGKREINPSAPEWQRDEGKRKVRAGVDKEIDMLFLDKKALVPSRLVVVEKSMMRDRSEWVKARLTARGDQDPGLLSLVRSDQTSAPTVRWQLRSPHCKRSHRWTQMWSLET